MWIRGSLFAFVAVSLQGGDWIRPANPQDTLVWGRTDGIVFGLPSTGGMRGPRGLIRVGVPLPGGQPELVNFIAIEPVVTGYTSRFSRMGFSELDMSQLDPGQRGKRLWVEGATQGVLESIPRPPSILELLGRPPQKQAPLERLSVHVEVERFAVNKTHVYVILSMLSDQPDELRISVFAHDDSPPVEELTVTATMGNYERLRRLWLKNQVVVSTDTAVGIDEFRDLANFPPDEMLRYGEGDALVLCTTNELEPGAVPVAEAPQWTYKPPKLTQYWRVPAHDIQPDLRTKVNVRRTYWASRVALPGGTAFENFEVRQRYVPGQTFVFGLTPKSPPSFQPPIPHVASPRPE
jgi:hypothetical protein